jgi:hypothetical protein
MTFKEFGLIFNEEYNNLMKTVNLCTQISKKCKSKVKFELLDLLRDTRIDRRNVMDSQLLIEKVGTHKEKIQARKEVIVVLKAQIFIFKALYNKLKNKKTIMERIVSFVKGVFV